MNSTPKLVVLALGLAALVAACEEEVTVEPPDPVEQIQYARSYVLADNGLPNNEVTSFLVLGNGELWIGTHAGVARYPNIGAEQSTDIVTEVSGLPHPQVRDMAEHNGKVYVGTWGGGIGIYDVAGDVWSQIRPAPTGLTDGFIGSVASSPTEDRVYLASNNGVFIYNPVDETFTHFSTIDDGIPPTSADGQMQAIVSTLAVQEDAGVVQRWYAPRVEVRLPADRRMLHGITVSTAATTFKYTTTNSGLVEPNVNDVYYDAQDGSFWVAYVSKGISRVNVAQKTWVHYDLVDGLLSNTVLAITRAKDNDPTSNDTVIWAATQNGLAKLVNNRWQSYAVANGLPSSRLRSVFSDDGVRLWAGFVDAGAVRIH